MNPRRRALLAVGLAVLIVSAGSIQGHETYAFDSAEREATLLETTNAFRARSEPVVVRFCPPVSSIANCSDCPDHFEVEPCVTSVTDLAQFSCTVCYDDAVFEVSKVLASGLTQDCQLDWSETSGCVSFTGNCEPGVNGLGPIAKISFVRRGTAFPSWLNWARAELRDSRGQSIASSTEPGCVSSDCIPGDVWRSCDCKIDVADVLWCVVDWLQPFPSICPRCDMEPDGDVDRHDCAAIVGLFRGRCRECGPAPASQAWSAPPEAARQMVTIGEATAMHVVPTRQMVAPNDEFAIDINVENASTVFGFQFSLAFDPEVLHVDDVQLGPFLGGAPLAVGPNVDQENGVLHFGGADILPARGSGTLAHIVLRASPSGRSTLDLFDAQLCTASIIPPDLVCFDPDEVRDGQVVVAELIYLPIVRKQQ